jgi:hypothetical protein
MALVSVALAGFSTDRTSAIRPGMTQLYTPMVFTSADGISENETVNITVQNPQQYMQNQTFTSVLTYVSGTLDITVTAAGKVNATDASWTTIGTGSISGTTATYTTTISSTTPINYNWLRLTFVAGAGAEHAHITSFELKTANAFSIPVNSGTLTIGRATSGTIVVTTKDDDANCATTYRAGGTGALTLGAGTGTTAITSSDWAISATGVQTGMGAATFDGVITATGGLTIPTLPSSYWAASGPAALATQGTDAACTNGGRFWVSLNIPYNSTITGLAYLVGSVGATDSVIVQLCNSAGVEVATSKKTGIHHGDLVGTAAQFQSVAFTTPYAAVAGRYFAVVQFNGTTAKFRAYPVPGAKFIANTAAGTYDVKADITPGTSYVADKAPFVMTY